MWSYVRICPLFDLLPLGRPWNCTTCFEMARALSDLVRFCGFSAANGHSMECVKYIEYETLRFFLIYDCLMISRCLCHSCWLFQPKKKTVFQQSGAGTLQRSIEGMSTGHTLAAGDVALPGSSKFSNTRSKGYLGLYYYTKYNSYPQVGIIMVYNGDITHCNGINPNKYHYTNVSIMGYNGDIQGYTNKEYAWLMVWECFRRDLIPTDATNQTRCEIFCPSLEWNSMIINT